MIWIHLYFGLTKLVYSFLDNQRKKIYGIELMCSIVFILIAFIIDLWVCTNNIYFNLFLSILFGSLFIVSSLLIRYIYSIKKSNSQKVPVGIINIVWISLMGIVYGGILFVSKFDVITETIDQGKSNDYYNMYYDELKYIIGHAINFVIVLGTILAACMTIIWTGAIWRNKENIKDYKQTTNSSAKMVLAFFIIIFSVGFWVGLPLVLKMLSIKDFL